MDAYFWSYPNDFSTYTDNVIIPLDASTIIHSRIDIVVLLETAFDTICTPFNRFDFEQTNFM